MKFLSGSVVAKHETSVVAAAALDQILLSRRDFLKVF